MGSDYGMAIVQYAKLEEPNITSALVQRVLLTFVCRGEVRSGNSCRPKPDGAERQRQGAETAS